MYTASPSPKSKFSPRFFVLQRYLHPMFMFYYSCSSERNAPCPPQQFTYSRAERSCTIAMVSFSTALNSDYGQTRKIFFSLQSAVLPPERIWCTPASLLYKLLL